MCLYSIHKIFNNFQTTPIVITDGALARAVLGIVLLDVALLLIVQLTIPLEARGFALPGTSEHMYNGALLCSIGGGPGSSGFATRVLVMSLLLGVKKIGFNLWYDLAVYACFRVVAV